MFFAVTIFVIILGIASAVLILRSGACENTDISKIASEFEITEIDA